MKEGVEISNLYFREFLVDKLRETIPKSVDFIEDFEEQIKNIERAFPGLRESQDLQEEMISRFNNAPKHTGARQPFSSMYYSVCYKDSIPELIEAPRPSDIKKLINKAIVYAFIAYPSLQDNYDWLNNRELYDFFFARAEELSGGKLINLPLRKKYAEYFKNYLTYVSPVEGQVFFCVKLYSKFLERYKEYLPPSREFYKTLSMSEAKTSMKSMNIVGEDLFEIFEDLGGEDPEKIRDLLFIFLVLMEVDNENLFNMRASDLRKILKGVYKEKGESPLSPSNNTEALIMKNVLEGIISDYVDEHISFEDSLDNLGMKEVTLWKRIKTQSRRASKKLKKRINKTKS